MKLLFSLFAKAFSNSLIILLITISVIFLVTSSVTSSDDLLRTLPVIPSVSL